MKTPLHALWLSVSLLVAPFAAQAIPVTWQVQGVITSVDDANGALPISASIGDSFTFAFTFDNAIADSNPSPLGGFFGPPLNMTVTIGQNTVSFVPEFNLWVQTMNDFFSSSLGGYVDQFDVAGGAFLGTGSFRPLLESRLDLRSVTSAPGSALSSDQLPETLDPSLFAIRSFSLVATNELRQFGRLAGEVRELPLSVPEPSTLTLLGLGLLGLAATSRRRSN